MAQQDYYEILGVDRNTDQAQIKKAYRNLALKYHPDRNPDDAQAAEKMKEINEAYAVLSDPEKRSLYNRYGHAGLKGYTRDDLFRGADFSSLLREFGLSDMGLGFGLFDEIFGRSRRPRGPQRGVDLRYDLEVTLEDVAHGADKTFSLPRVETCPGCRGQGAEPGGVKACPRCGGAGQLVTERRSGYTLLRQISPCDQCQGRGQIVIRPCRLCHGQGETESTQEIKVTIPKGADTGYTILVPGKGESGEAGAGDLHVVLSVSRHPIFERHGDDIYVVKEIDMVKAALGGQVNHIPGLYGELKLNIDEGTQSGAVYRIAKQGLPRISNHGKGDEYVVIKVVTPINLTPRQKQLLREFDKLTKERQDIN